MLQYVEVHVKPTAQPPFWNENARVLRAVIHVTAAATPRKAKDRPSRPAGDQRNAEYVQMILDQKAQATARAKEKQKLLTRRYHS